METVIQIRVRYNECDSMGVAHHAVYPVWFELGRTELLREQGGCYRDLEEQGLFLVVSELSIKYKGSAKYDDVLELTTTVEEVSRVRIMHSYILKLHDVVITTATTTLACVNNDGVVCEIPKALTSTV